MKLCEYVAKTFLDEPGQCILEAGHPGGHIILPVGATLESVLAQIQERSRIDLQTRNTELVEQRRALQRELEALRATQYTTDLVVERQGRLHAENELEGERKRRRYAEEQQNYLDKELKKQRQEAENQREGCKMALRYNDTLLRHMRYIAEFQLTDENRYRSWEALARMMQSIANDALKGEPAPEVKVLEGSDGWVIKQAVNGSKNPWGDGCWHGNKGHPCAQPEVDKLKEQLKETEEKANRWREAHYSGRYIVEKVMDGVKICYGEHDKHSPCEWSYYVAE